MRDRLLVPRLADLGMFSTAARALAASAALVLIGAGCGEDRGNREVIRAEAKQSSEARLFHESGCADCHSLTAANARARVGPDLDSATPTYTEVARKVRLGGSGMPAFEDDLSASQIAALASFVSQAGADPTESAQTATAAEFEPDGTRLVDCQGSFSCFEQAFGNLAFERGPNAALDELDRVIAADPEVERDCHRITHIMGAAALGRFEGHVGKAFSRGSAICASGYYHGVAERAFSGSSRGELGQVALALCRDRSIRRTTFLAYQCVHGLGHGLMIHTGYDLPGALRVCDGLSTGWDRTACTGGVFMENISTSYGVKSQWLRDDDPLYPCPVVASRHKLYCYLMVTSRILPLVGNDFRRAAALCRRSEPGWAATCFQSLGRDASGQARGDVPLILKLCKPAGEAMGECLYGAARDLTYNDAGGRRAGGLCRRAAGRLQPYCFSGVGSILRDLHPRPAARAAACARVSPVNAHRAFCREGAGIA